jgi:phage pi2 protein 07
VKEFSSASGIGQRVRAEDIGYVVYPEDETVKGRQVARRMELMERTVFQP